MGYEQINKMVGSVAKLINDSEKITVSLLSTKLARSMAQYPEDRTIGIMAGIVSRMDNANQPFISRGELKDLYKKLYTNNTKFAELFGDELGEMPTLQGPKIYDRDGEENKLSLVQTAYQKLSDPILANALNGAFGNEHKEYSDEAVKNATNICLKTLNNLGITAKTIEVVAGQEDVIICIARFETPKGISNVLIPMEVVSGKTLIPSVFVGNTGPIDLTEKNITNYIKAYAGSKLNVSASKLLEGINIVKNAEKHNISNLELAATKLNASKEEKNDFIGNEVLYQKIESPVKEVKTASLKDKEAETFASTLTSSVGVANFTFGEHNVNMGRKLIASQLTNYGFTNPQVSVMDCNENTVIYAVSMNAGKVAFKVPVKASKDKMGNPDIIISNGSVAAFSKENIYKLLNNSNVDNKALATASPIYNLKASELIAIVREAAAEKNYARAEDALNVLSQGNDQKAYFTALSAFQSSLSPENKSAECSCSMIVKSANSQHQICGHTNLPLHKVYQDKYGNCRPLYRKNMDETYEGGIFVAHKILL